MLLECEVTMSAAVGLSALRLAHKCPAPGGHTHAEELLCCVAYQLSVCKVSDTAGCCLHLRGQAELTADTFWETLASNRYDRYGLMTHDALTRHLLPTASLGSSCQCIFISLQTRGQPARDMHNVCGLVVAVHGCVMLWQMDCCDVTSCRMPLT